MNLPACRLRDGDFIAVKGKSAEMPVFVVAREQANVEKTPGYIEVFSDRLTAHFLRAPARTEVPIICDVHLVVEYYAR